MRSPSPTVTGMCPVLGELFSLFPIFLPSGSCELQARLHACPQLLTAANPKVWQPPRREMSHPGTAAWESQQTANSLTPAQVGFPPQIWRLPAAPAQSLLQEERGTTNSSLPGGRWWMEPKIPLRAWMGGRNVELLGLLSSSAEHL